MDRVRTALVGCGKVGQIHAQALGTLAESELVGVCDVDGARASSFAAQYGGRPFTDVEAMIRECGVQALCIGTPHPLHAGPTIQAAEAGVHVLVEKPLAASLEDCDAMIAAARRRGVKLGVISQRRWYEPVLRMKAAIDAGKIGRPVLGTFVMYSWRDPAYYRSDPWRGRWDTEGGRRAREPVAAHARPARVAHGRRGRRGGRLLGQPQPSLRRGRGQRRGDPPVPRRRTRLDRQQSGAEAGDLYQGAHPWVQRRVGRRREPTGARPSSLGCRGSPSRRSTTSGPSPARKTGSRRSRRRIALGSRLLTR